MTDEPQVSASGFWMDNAFEPNKFIIVDCGYVRHPRARSNAERLLKAIGVKRGQRGFVEVAGFARVLVRVPHAKEPCLNRFKNITKPGNYAWTTYTYERTGPQFRLKYAG